MCTTGSPIVSARRSTATASALPFPMGKGVDVCAVKAAGANN
jgi:hypothetical protein